MNEPRKTRDLKCRHDATTPIKVSKTRTNLVCCDCDEIIGWWEDAPQQEGKPIRKLTKKELEEMGGK